MTKRSKSKSVLSKKSAKTTAAKPSGPAPSRRGKHLTPHNMLLGLILVAFTIFFILSDKQEGNASLSEHSDNLPDTVEKSQPSALHDLDQALHLRPYLHPLTLNGSSGRDETSFTEKQKDIIKVEKGDTFINLLNRAGISTREAMQAVDALKDTYSPRSIRPGQEIHLAMLVATNPDPDSQNLQSRILDKLSLRANAEQDIVLSRKSDSSFEVQEKTRALEKDVRYAKSVIETSLFKAGHKAGVPMSVLTGLISIYSFDIDFQRDIQKGDGFEVYFETFSDNEGNLVKTGEIIYANLRMDGQDFPLYYHTPESGFSDYFSPDGRSVRKVLMRTPIDGARLSSGFGMRKHPVLGYSKMHKGTDFAAPRGTPIFAAGNGVVEKAGPFSSYGNYIRIRHNSTYKTAYAHMKGFAKDIKAGTRVKQGQIIGYVGTTGRSTGPHLHYEVMVDGKQINPANLKLPSGEHLKDKELEGFKAAMADIEKTIASYQIQKERIVQNSAD